MAGPGRAPLIGEIPRAEGCTGGNRPAPGLGDAVDHLAFPGAVEPHYQQIAAQIADEYSQACFLLASDFAKNWPPLSDRTSRTNSRSLPRDCQRSAMPGTEYMTGRSRLNTPNTAASTSEDKLRKASPCASRSFACCSLRFRYPFRLGTARLLTQGDISERTARVLLRSFLSLRTGANCV
jgi:hypothetical protein